MSEDLFEFGGFVLDRAGCELRRRGVVVPLQRIPLDLLCLLVERRGRLVTREEILERVWGKGVFVDTEASINTAIRKIRRALHDDPDAPRFVVTVPARGYRFIEEVGVPETNEQERYRGRPRSVMVGRERELASVMNGLEDALSGRGRLFLISGEPGVGKTRLAHEVAAGAAVKRMTLLIGHCAEQDEAVPYLPFVEMLEGFVDRFADRDRLRSALGEQAQELARVLPKLRSILPELPPPFELAPAVARRHLFNCFCDFVARIAREQPTLMILEDLHWADDSTLSLLDHLTQRLSGLPLLIVGTYRDAQQNITRGLAKALEDLIRGRQATWIGLKKLSRDEVAVMLETLSAKTPPVPMVGEFYAETDGNPFFVEELFRHLEEESRLYDSAGRLRADLRLAELEAPPRLRLVVARRLERLSAHTQKMLATAATIGRIFSFELLQAFRGTDADSLLDCVEEAESAGLIFPVPEGPRTRLEFSHELIRQALIGGLSSARREKLHLEVAKAIDRICRAASESGSAESLNDWVAELAYHYAAGGDAGRAARYCLHAVRRFRNLGSNAEAMTQFERGLELLRKLPENDRRAKLEMGLVGAILQSVGDTRGFASIEFEQLATRVMVLSRRPGISWKDRWEALYGVLWVHLTRPDVQKACEITGELVALAEANGSTEHQADAETWLACARMYSGDFERAAEGFDRAWAPLESISTSATAPTALYAGELPGARARSIEEFGQWEMGTQENNRALSGWNQWFLGYPDRALKRMKIATDIAHSGAKTMLADVHGFATYIHDLRREPEQMRARAEARLAISTKPGYAAGSALSQIYLGWADVLAGDLDRGLERMRRHSSELRAMGFEAGAPYQLALIATALGKVARFDEALRTIDESLSIIERTGQWHYEAEVHRIKGELLLAQDRANTAQARQSFRFAIDVARKQHAKSWELRATTSLARLLAQEGEHDRALAMLVEIYDSFTEGFDTADLKDAKALLDELTAEIPVR
jgi:DNA-binding winged helix-turn-helix (wHTH) protein/tetratricopeptide (TPR) repeat protein